jgi:hypothetical protein
VKGWVWVVVIVAGVVLLCGVVAAATGSGRDHTGDTVRAQKWADAVCGTVGAWEGDLHAIRDEYQRNSFAAQMSDGGTGDNFEGRVTLRESVDRAIRVTEDTLQEGLKRAGNPDAPNGEQASATLRAWAQRTEHNLRVAKQELKHKPDSTSDAYALVVTQASALVRSILDGRAAFNQVSQLDPALASAINGSKRCQELKEGQP